MYSCGCRCNAHLSHTSTYMHTTLSTSIHPPLSKIHLFHSSPSFGGRQPVSVSCSWTIVLLQWWPRQGTGIPFYLLMSIKRLFGMFPIIIIVLNTQFSGAYIQSLDSQLVLSFSSPSHWLLGFQTCIYLTPSLCTQPYPFCKQSQLWLKRTFGRGL